MLFILNYLPSYFKLNLVILGAISIDFFIPALEHEEVDVDPHVLLDCCAGDVI